MKRQRWWFCGNRVRVLHHHHHHHRSLSSRVVCLSNPKPSEVEAQGQERTT
ncbi:hypothetical protein OROHE_006720 [Orobanche hederae]